MPSPGTYHKSCPGAIDGLAGPCLDSPFSYVIEASFLLSPDENTVCQTARRDSVRYQGYPPTGRAAKDAMADQNHFQTAHYPGGPAFAYRTLYAPGVNPPVHRHSIANTLIVADAQALLSSRLGLMPAHPDSTNPSEETVGSVDRKMGDIVYSLHLLYFFDPRHLSLVGYRDTLQVP